jgi:hypothetical protein
MKIVRGSSFAYSGLHNASFQLVPGKEQRQAGFRLVHDDSGRVIRDGSWRNAGAYVREGRYVMVDPDYCSSALGFRLSREDT